MAARKTSYDKSTEHEHNGANQRGSILDFEEFHPIKHKHTGEENMNKITDIYRSCDWQEEEKQVGRIKCGSQTIAGEWMTGKIVRIPQGEVTIHISFLYEKLIVIKIVNYVQIS
jgi:hypothetical protein